MISLDSLGSIYHSFITFIIFDSSHRCVLCIAFESLYPTTVPGTQETPNQYCLTGCRFREHLFRIYCVTDAATGAVGEHLNKLQFVVCVFLHFNLCRGS